MTDEVSEIVNLYKQFERYQEYADSALISHILPSLALNQYKVHKDEEVFGFVNWALLNEDQEKTLLTTHTIPNDQWLSGDRVWIIDILATKNMPLVADRTKAFFTQLLGCNQKVKWLRFKDDKIVHKQVTTKRHFV